MSWMQSGRLDPGRHFVLPQIWRIWIPYAIELRAVVVSRSVHVLSVLSLSWQELCQVVIALFMYSTDSQVGVWYQSMRPNITNYRCITDKVPQRGTLRIHRGTFRVLKGDFSGKKTVLCGDLIRHPVWTSLLPFIFPAGTPALRYINSPPLLAMLISSDAKDSRKMRSVSFVNLLPHSVTQALKWPSMLRLCLCVCLTPS